MENRKKVLELFAGSRSIGKAAKKLGMQTCSVDIEPFEDIDIVSDIEYLSPLDIPFYPDMIWASPLCTSYTLAAISTHRDGTKPKSDLAIKSDRVVRATLELIAWFKARNPKLKWYMENPRGMLRKMPFMQGLPLTTITYCSYGDIRMKPTDIWTNNLASVFNQDGWKPRPMCCNNNPECSHERAPRGSKTGTQGLKGSYNRSQIPVELSEDILNQTFNTSPF